MMLPVQENGYAMVALLVALSIMAILSTVAMPVWRQMSQREKEAELIFRGEQYARAIGLFQRRAGPGMNPPNLDILVEQRFLRRKYKDPITGEDFIPIPAASAASATPGIFLGAASTGGRGQTDSQPPAPARGSVGGSPPGVGAPGDVIGVVSKSADRSIRIYNGRNFYNEWQFVYVAQTQAPGVGGAPGESGQGSAPGQVPAPGIGGVGGRSGRGSQPADGPFVPSRDGPLPSPQRPPGG